MSVAARNPIWAAKVYFVLPRAPAALRYVRGDARRKVDAEEDLLPNARCRAARPRHAHLWFLLTEPPSSGIEPTSAGGGNQTQGLPVPWRKYIMRAGFFFPQRADIDLWSIICSNSDNSSWEEIPGPDYLNSPLVTQSGHVRLLPALRITGLPRPTLFEPNGPVMPRSPDRNANFSGPVGQMPLHCFSLCPN